MSSPCPAGLHVEAAPAASLRTSVSLFRSPTVALPRTPTPRSWPFLTHFAQPTRVGLLFHAQTLLSSTNTQATPAADVSAPTKSPVERWALEMGRDVHQEIAGQILN